MYQPSKPARLIGDDPKGAPVPQRISKRNGLEEPESPHLWLEYQAPAILFGIGLIAVVVSAFALAGEAGFLGSLIFIGLLLIVQTPLTLAGMFLIGALFGISYGLLKSAGLKLAAILMVVAGTAFVGSALGYSTVAQLLLCPLASWSLFSILFDLDARETIVSGLGLWLLGMAFHAGVTVVAAAVLVSF